MGAVPMVPVVDGVDPTDCCQVVCAWSLWCPVCGEVHPIDVEVTQ